MWSKGRARSLRHRSYKRLQGITGENMTGSAPSWSRIIATAAGPVPSRSLTSEVMRAGFRASAFADGFKFTSGEGKGGSPFALQHRLEVLYHQQLVLNDQNMAHAT